MSEVKQEAKIIIEEFSLFSDWEDKYGYIIDLGKSLPNLDESKKIDTNKVNGCTSQVWLICSRSDNKIIFQADSDSFIVKGLVAIILRLFSDKRAEEIKEFNIEDFFNALGLKKYLTPNRSNGFFSIVNKIKELS